MNPGILYTALSGILYGSIGFSGSHLMRLGFSVNDLLFWRFLISVLLLAPLMPKYVFGRKLEPAGSAQDAGARISLKTLAALFCLSGFFYGVGTAAYFESTKSIGTGLAMVIFFAYPIVVVCLSRFVHKEPLTPVTLASLALIVLGCGLIALGDAVRFEPTGIVLATISGVMFGCYVFFSKGTSRTLPPLLATFVVCLANTATYALYAFAVGQSIIVPASTSAWLHFLGFSVFGTVLPVLLMLLGLKTISANKASIIAVLEPVTTLAVGAWVLHEQVNMTQFVGALVILSSALLVQWPSASAVASRERV